MTHIFAHKFSLLKYMYWNFLKCYYNEFALLLLFVDVYIFSSSFCMIHIWCDFIIFYLFALLLNVYVFVLSTPFIFAISRIFHLCMSISVITFILFYTYICILLSAFVTKVCNYDICLCYANLSFNSSMFVYVANIVWLPVL